jgi:hypothetical protein
MINDHVVRRAEAIVAIAEYSLELRRAQRRLIVMAVVLIVSGVVTAVAGVLLSPRPESILFALGGMFCGVVLYAAVRHYRVNRDLLSRLKQLRT